MTTVVRLLRGLMPVIAASAAVTAAALPAVAAVQPPTTPTATATATGTSATATPADTATATATTGTKATPSSSATTGTKATAKATTGTTATTGTAGGTVTATATGTAAANGSEWWLTALHVSAALKEAPAAGKGVTVAVLSTGVDATHPDLSGSVTEGPDFSGTGRKQGSAYWGYEGTAVASLIAGHGTKGITGIAPQVQIVSARVTVEYDDPLAADAAVSKGLPNAIAEGIRWAVSEGATVIALPLDPGEVDAATPGSPAVGGSAAEKDAVSYALAHNVLLVAPAGDNGAKGNAVNYPAAYPGVIAVGATTPTGQLSSFSNTGSYVTLTAPGAGTTPGQAISGLTTDPAAGLSVAAPDGGYETLASSDMSAALVAGVAALIQSSYPQLTVPEVTQALGHGELDAATALSRAAAIAAAHPQPTQPTAAPAAPAVRSASPTAAAKPSDPGGLLRSLIVYLAIGAGVLIALLAAALTLTRFRRRTRPGRYLGPGRHAKGQPLPLQAPIPARVVIWPSMQTTPAQSTPTQSAQALAGGILGRPSTAQRRPQPVGNPPWQPASEPGAPPSSLPTVLPAQVIPPEQQEKPLAPWEQSPEEFAVGPQIGEPPWSPAVLSAQVIPPEQQQEPLPPWEQSPEEFAVAPPTEEAPWPITSTGPLYVWNPAQATGPIIVGRNEER